MPNLTGSAFSQGDIVSYSHTPLTTLPSLLRSIDLTWEEGSALGSCGLELSGCLPKEDPHHVRMGLSDPRAQLRLQPHYFVSIH